MREVKWEKEESRKKRSGNHEVGIQRMSGEEGIDSSRDSPLPLINKARPSSIRFSSFLPPPPPPHTNFILPLRFCYMRS